jgi:hypothetical protein
MTFVFELWHGTFCLKGMTTISELKFACPVCQQHIACDPGLGGLQMKCPTCLATMIIPKAPTGATTKLILCARQVHVQPARTRGKILEPKSR